MALLGTGGIVQGGDGSFYTMLSDHTKKPVTYNQYGFYTYSTSFGSKDYTVTNFYNVFSLGITATWHNIPHNNN
jgi:hypothetical protein